MKFIPIISFLLLGQWTHAQSEKLISQLEFGGIRGIQISKSFPILKSGYIANVNLSKPFGQHVQFGFGSAYISLEKENFIPIYAYVKAHKKSGKNSYYFESSLGVSKATNYDFKNSIDTKFSGGTYFAPGFGYRYNVNKKWSLSSGINYIMQKAKLDQIDENQNVFYTEPLNIDLIVFKIGVIFK
jgi:hypothetical protein